MDSADKPKKPSSPSQDRYYPSTYGPEQPGNYPPIPQTSSAPPASAPGSRVNGHGRSGSGSTGDILSGSASAPYRPYDAGSAPQSLPPQSLPPQQPQQPYQPQLPPPPPSLVEVAPQPTMSTAGSVVGGGALGAALPPGSGYGAGYNSGYGAGYGGRPAGGPAGGPPAGPPMLTQSPGPVYATNDTAAKADLRAARATVEAGLGRLLELQRQQQQHLQYGPGAASVPNSTAAAVQEQLRLQTGSVLRDLRFVRRALAATVKAAESHRFRRWLVGGILATFIPLVRRLFRRPGRGAPPPPPGSAAAVRIVAANDTEYAFARSRSLVDRMLSSVRRRSGLASVAFFVFAVLYVFTNEVSLRVARTVGRRLKKLSAKIERGDEPLDDKDLKQLAGWRWRVLLWGRH